MNTWLELKRKYGGDVHEVLAARAEMHRRLWKVQGDLAGNVRPARKTDFRGGARVAKREAQGLRVIREKAAEGTGEDRRGEGHRPARLQEADFQIRLVPLAEPGPAGDCSLVNS